MRTEVYAVGWGLSLNADAPCVRPVAAGFDGVEDAVPDDDGPRDQLRNALDRAGLAFIAQESLAAGNAPGALRDDYHQRLERACAFGPCKVNAHTGRDHFSDSDDDSFLDTAADVSRQWGMPIVHETHWTPALYSPPTARYVFERYPDQRATADLSRWTVVSESLLDDHADALAEAIGRADHARVGSVQLAQVPRPFGPEWETERQPFTGWWRQIAQARADDGADVLTVTCEAGPPPYLWAVDGETVADPWDQNVVRLAFLREAL